jgi:hypothetical protein
MCSCHHARRAEVEDSLLVYDYDAFPIAAAGRVILQPAG